MDNLLPGFEPSEADMIQMALEMPLDKKIEKAIKFYQTYCEGAYGAFSGGKDSCVIKQLAVDAGVDTIRWVYSNVTIDPPELTAFIRAHHPDVEWDNPPIGLMNRVVQRGDAPTRLNRWCCAEYKERGGEDQNKIIGVRIAESARRAKLWKQVVPRKDNRSILFLAPIVYWTDEDVWGYIKSRNIPYCSLYDEGFSRLGCVGCPLAGKHNRAMQMERWPKFEAAWRMTLTKLWMSRIGTKNRKGNESYVNRFSSPDEFFEWWISGESQDDNDQCVFDDIMGQR